MVRGCCGENGRFRGAGGGEGNRKRDREFN